MSSRVRRSILTASWFVATIGASVAGAQQPGTPAWLRARLEGRFDARSLVTIQRIIDSAYALGIPAEPLVNKALEGRSKGASTDAIAKALRSRAINLVGAREALGTSSLQQELSAGADALTAGVDARSLERLRHDRPGQPLVVALGVMTDLIAGGIPVNTATQSVLELTKAGIADEQLVAFRRDVERDVGMGASPASAATLRLSSLATGLYRDPSAPPGRLRTRRPEAGRFAPEGATTLHRTCERLRAGERRRPAIVSSRAPRDDLHRRCHVHALTSDHVVERESPRPSDPVRPFSRRSAAVWHPERGWAVAVAALAAMGARTMAAQRTEVTVSVDAGAATIAYDEFRRAAVGTLTPMIRVEHGRATFIARGAYSAFEGGNHSIEGTVAASAVSPAFLGLRGELFGTASNTKYSVLHDDASTNVLAIGRLHLANARRGVWVGTGLGAISEGFFFPDDMVQFDAGGWIRAGEATLTAQVQPTRVGDSSYTDFLAASRWSWLHADLSLSGGYRRGAVAGGASRWAELGGSYWITPHVALVAGAGVFPAELWRGLPGGRYASTAVRLSSRPPRQTDPELLAELTRPYEMSRIRRSRAAARRFSVDVLPDGTRLLTVRVPDARSVEIMADFTDWAPMTMSPAGAGAWAYSVFIGPGIHRLNIRIDGGAWIAPPGLTVVRDEFGGEVGLLVVQ